MVTLYFPTELTSTQIVGGARGGGSVGREQQRGEVGDPGEGNAASEAPQRGLRGARVAVSSSNVLFSLSQK